MMLPPTKESAKIDKEIFKNIFRDHWEGFKLAHPAYNTDQYEDPVQKMLECGDALFGYSEYICMHKEKRKVPFNCKSCFCLSCAKKYTDDFVSQVSKMLHPGVIYRHIVLTMPKQLREPFHKERHRGDLLSELMRCGYRCLEDVVSKAKRHKLKIGCIVVVQTHGRSGRYNPHLHIIMTSGGIQEDSEKWFDLGYFNYEIIHKKWQYHLLNMVKSYFGSTGIKKIVDDLWKDYPNGFVANVSKGNVPEFFKGLARYLAKYVASPPIAIKRIVDYDGDTVKYWYQDHKSKSQKFERVDVHTFIGRMVQHIFPKWFQRVRYFGLEATKTYEKWKEIIQKGIKKLGRIVKGAYQIVFKKSYRERYKEIVGRDPMKCGYCGSEMELWKVWHPKYGVLFDELENLKAGIYEQESEPEKNRERGHSVRPSTGVLQLPLFPLQS